MNINKKIISFLIFSFFLISAVFTYNSIFSIKKNQEENIRLFKKEFLELAMEMSEKKSNIFFSGLSIHVGASSTREAVVQYILNAYPTESRDIVIIDIKSKEIIERFSNNDIALLLTPEIIDNYLQENLLNQKTDFDFDNFEKFELDSTHTVVPSKVHFRVFEEPGIMVALGQKFLTGKVRIEFIERQNQILYKSQLYSLIILFSIIIIAVIIFMTLVMHKIVVKPLYDIISVVKLITAGDLNKRVEIKTNDEMGQLGMAFNEMTGRLQELYFGMDRKVKEKTDQLSVKVKELDEQNVAVLKAINEMEESKKYSDQLAKDLEKFKLAVDNASDQIVITDKNGIVLYGNKAVYEITGYHPDEAIGKKAGALWKSPMPSEYYAKLWDTIKNKKEPFIGEIQNRRRNGEIYTATIDISLVYDKDGSVIYYVAIERDISKEKEVDRAKTEFVSLASHQLRAPLASMSQYIETLLDVDTDTINEQQKTLLNQISDGNKRMIRLVDDLLNVSTLDMGKLTFDIKHIDVISLLKDVVNENKSLILKKGLSLEEHYDDKTKTFSADEKVMKMIFQNILSNAVEYTSQSGTVKVSLSKANKSEEIGGKIIDENSVVFTVSDSGIGIPVNQQGMIFTKLFRADNAKESETEGAGLGLYLVKSVVELSGGMIWFKSEENKGSTFFVSFKESGMKVDN